MLISDNDTIARVQSFNKYAQFISEKFNVTVCFDGLKAHTDGKTITLPNIMGMSQEETDFLYCILLHEVGHIRYTPFTKENFAKVKSNNHFYLINAIEDARIENLLIKDFDGAHKIFEDLYNKFASDKKFMERIFKFSSQDADLFKALGTYIHYQIINLKDKLNLTDILGADLAKKTLNFVKTNDIDTLIFKDHLNNWDDVVSLANKIYDIFFEKKKDKSERNDINEIQDLIEKSLNEDLKNLQEKTEASRNEIQTVSEQIKAAKDFLEKIKHENDSVIQEKQNQLESNRVKQDLIEESINDRESLKNEKERKEILDKKILSKKDLVNDLERKLNELQAVKEPDDKIKSKIEKTSDKLTKSKEVLENYQKKVGFTDAEISDLTQRVNNLPENLKEAELDNIKKDLSELENEEKTLSSEVQKIKDSAYDASNKVKLLTEELRNKKADYTKKVSQALKSIQDSMDEAGIPINIIPSFEKNPSWDEADTVQQEFDSRASQEEGVIVVNGAGIGGTGQRDVLTMVETAREDLKNIDVAEIFKQKNKTSLFDSFNDLSKVNNTKEYLTKDHKYITTRRHIPLTTQLDLVKNQTSSSGAQLTSIRKNHAETIKKIKNIFKLRLKTTRKDKFKGNQEEGNLDQRSLWKLATRSDDNYFEINTPKFVNNVAASIALDVSGSMDKDYTENGKKLKELALFLSDGLSDCFVNHEIVGFHAPVSHEMRAMTKGSSYNRTSNFLETIVYRNFKDRGNSGIQNIQINCTDNSDGESLKLIAGRLLRERSKRKVLFVLSDGKPFLSDSDVSVLDQDLKLTLEWAAKNKIEVFAFGFNEDGKKFYGNKFCYVQKYQDVIDFLWKNIG